MGTLDSLLTLSDELVKTCTLVEGVASKIRRQLSELNRESAEASPNPFSHAQPHARARQLVDLAVDGVPVRRYLQAFSWNEAKCAPGRAARAARPHACQAPHAPPAARDGGEAGGGRGAAGGGAEGEGGGV